MTRQGDSGKGKKARGGRDGRDGRDGKDRSSKISGGLGGKAAGSATVTDFDDHLNRSLDDVINLLEREIERLKASLESYRLSEHPQRGEIVRWHVRTLDERQDALEDLQSLIIAEQEGKALH